MNQATLVEKIAHRTQLTKQQVEAVIEAFETEVIAALKAGDEVTLTGFLALTARKRSARQGVNPRNPTEKIQIPEVTVPKFKAGKNLKEALKSAPPPS